MASNPTTAFLALIFKFLFVVLLRLVIFLLCMKRLVRFVQHVCVKIQGRRRLLESGTAIERRRCSPSAEGMSGGEHERGYGPLWFGGFGGCPP